MTHPARIQRLQIRHLHLLDQIEKQGSLSAAAAGIGVSQPRATNMLHEVEDAFGCALLERSARGTRLNKAGAIALERLRIALGALDGVALALQHREPQPVVRLREKRQAEVRSVIAKADQKLSEVLSGCLFKDLADVKGRLDELVTLLTPMAKELALEAAKNANAIPDEDGVTNAIFDSVARLVARRTQGLTPQELTVLDKKMQALLSRGPALDARLNFLHHSILAADLMKRAEAIDQDPSSRTLKSTPLTMWELADLSEIASLEPLAHELGKYFNEPPQGTTHPGTQLKPSRLLEIRTRADAAGQELNDRKASLKSDAAPNLLSTLQRGELVKLSGRANEWLQQFPGDSDIQAIDASVTQRLQTLDDNITKAVLGLSGSVDASQLKNKDLLSLKDKIKKLDYVPAPVATALGAIEGVIAQRKDAAKNAFMTALRDAMNAGGSSAQLPAKLIECALPLQKANIAWAQLGEDLNPQQVGQWIETALRHVDVWKLDNARASLNAPEGRKLRNQLSSIKKPTDAQKLTSQYVGLLSQHLDAVMSGNQTPRGERKNR